MRHDDVLISGVRIGTYKIPTEEPESDGTLVWDSTTMVVVELTAGDVIGLGYTYGHAAVARLIDDLLAPVVVGRDALDVPAAWSAMVATLRNVGRPGIGATAVSAVDVALWDLKSRLLGLPLVDLLGRARDAVPAYGSGGFTSYDDDRLVEQLGGWVADGFTAVKMKVGRRPERDVARVRSVRRAIGDDRGLFVDANGAYRRKDALVFAERFGEERVSWFEEPVSSNDLDGLRLMRDRAPGGMDIAAGEYGWDLFDFRRLVEAGAVDVLQADATRCLGITGWMGANALCEAHALPLSAHTAPTLHLALCAAARQAVHLEWFFDHVRIERRLFDGFVEPRDGQLFPSTAPGLGVELRHADAAPFLDWRSG